MYGGVPEEEGLTEAILEGECGANTARILREIRKEIARNRGLSDGDSAKSSHDTCSRRFGNPRLAGIFAIWERDWIPLRLPACSCGRYRGPYH